MGYRISYDGGAATKVSFRSGNKKKWIFAMAVLLVLGMMAFPGGRLILRDILLPGNEEVTAEALEGFVMDLKAGESVSDAVEAFCLEIIHGG